MPAVLHLLNPSKPRRRLKKRAGNPTWEGPQFFPEYEDVDLPVEGMEIPLPRRRPAITFAEDQPSSRRGLMSRVTARLRAQARKAGRLFSKRLPYGPTRGPRNNPHSITFREGNVRVVVSSATKTRGARRASRRKKMTARKRPGAHALRVKRYMKEHPRTSFVRASQKVARQRRRRSNPMLPTDPDLQGPLPKGSKARNLAARNRALNAARRRKINKYLAERKRREAARRRRLARGTSTALVVYRKPAMTRYRPKKKSKKRGYRVYKSTRRPFSYKRKKKSGGGGGGGGMSKMSKAKRSAAARKGWRTRKRRGTKSVVRRSRRHAVRSHRRKSPSRVSLQQLKYRYVRAGKDYKRLAGGLSRMGKVGARRARQKMAAIRARRGALSVRIRSFDRRFAGGKYARRYGVTRVNPSLGGIFAAAWKYAPAFGTTAVSTAVAAVAGQKLPAYLPDAVKKAVPEGLKPYVPSIASGLVGIAAFAAMLMSKNSKVADLAPWALAGGMTAAVIHLLPAIKVKVKESPGLDAEGKPLPEELVEKTLGKALGLPIGEYVNVSGYVEVNGGHMLPVNGLGEYVPVSGMGDYVAQQVGMGAYGEGIFAKSSLGAIPDMTRKQIPLGRDWRHGLGEEISVQEVLEGGGSLSGSIFDP